MNNILSILESSYTPEELIELLIRYDAIDYEELLSLLAPYIKEVESELRDEVPFLQ